MRLLFSSGVDCSSLLLPLAAFNKNLLYDGIGKLNRLRSGNVSDL